MMPLLILGWMGLITLIVVAARVLLGEESRTIERVREREAASRLVEAASNADLDFLSREMPECQRVFGQFLSARTPESGTQFVFSPVNMAGRMERYFSLNPMIRLAPASIVSKGSGVLELPGGRAIEARWRAGDGREVDAVFLRERNQWRLDWEHFVRYSDYPWALFLAGSGEPQGEFRLLARQRLAEKSSVETGLSLVFYAPRFGYPAQPAAQSPEFTMAEDSADARLLEAAFLREKEGRRPFGADLPSVDPEGMIRVRVKIRRTEEGGTRRFEIEEVVACHWLAVEASGIPDPDDGVTAQPSAE